MNERDQIDGMREDSMNGMLIKVLQILILVPEIGMDGGFDGMVDWKKV